MMTIKTFLEAFEGTDSTEVRIYSEKKGHRELRYEADVDDVLAPDFFKNNANAYKDIDEVNIRSWNIGIDGEIYLICEDF